MEDSDLIGTEKNTLAQILRKLIQYLSFPVEESRVQNPVDIVVDVAPKSAIEQPTHPRPLIDIPGELHFRGEKCHNMN